MKKIAFFVLITFLVSCSTKDKAKNYYYLSSIEALDVGYPYGSIVYKGFQEYSFSDIIITAKVVEYNENSQFITTKQQLDNGLLKKWIHNRIKEFIRTNGYYGERKELKFYNVTLADTLLLKYDNSDSSINYLTNTVLASSLIQRMIQNDINYWIIQKSTDSLIGPLTKSEFKVVKKDMRLPNKLDLQ